MDSQWASKVIQSEYYGSSHYSYCANNPVIFVDPDGRAIYYTDSGMIIGEDNEVNDKRYVVVPESYASKTIDELVQLKDYDQSFRYALGLMLIDRIMENDYETVGNFKFVNETYSLEGATLEREGPDTIEKDHLKRIPEGVFNLKNHYSEKFKAFLYLLYNDIVAEDRNILLHAGNKFNETEGCILLGPSYDKNADQLLPPTRKTVNEFNNIVKALGPENVLVIINNNFR